MSELDTITRIKTLLRQQELEKQRQEKGVLILILGGSFEKRYASDTHNFHYGEDHFLRSVCNELDHVTLRCEYICLKDMPDENDYKNLILTASKAIETNLLIIGSDQALTHAKNHLERLENKTIHYYNIQTPHDLCRAEDFIELGYALARISPS